VGGEVLKLAKICQRGEKILIKGAETDFDEMLKATIGEVV